MSQAEDDAERLAREFRDLLPGGPKVIRTQPGWTPIVEQLLEDLHRIARETGRPLKVQSIKQKFGGLRVYAYPHSHEVERAIATAEERAAQSCEFCGAPSRTHNLGGWLTTCCPRCVQALAILRGGR